MTFTYVRVKDRGFEYDVAYDRGAPYAAFVLKTRRQGRIVSGATTFRSIITSPRKIKRLFKLADEQRKMEQDQKLAVTKRLWEGGLL